MSEDLHHAETSEANQSENVSPKRTTATQKTFVKLRVDGCVTLKEKGTLTFGNVIQCFIKRGGGIPPFTLGNLLLQGQFQMSCVFDDNELGIRLCCLLKS